jgi:hypothetical protein
VRNPASGWILKIRDLTFKLLAGAIREDLLSFPSPENPYVFFYLIDFPNLTRIDYVRQIRW